MKKVILSLVAVFALTITANAQENNAYKPVKSDVTAEFGFTGGILSPDVSFAKQGLGGDVMIKARYFTADNSAYRIGVYLHTLNSTQDLPNGKSESSSNTKIDLGFGLEKHFKGTDRLSPYIGGDAVLGFGFQSAENTATDATVSGPSSFKIGVKGVFGADYYFVKRAYLGVEAGLQIAYSSLGKTTTKVGGTETKVEGKSGFNINPLMVGIRLGYAF